MQSFRSSSIGLLTKKGLHNEPLAGIITMPAVVLELAYRLDLKSSALWDCGFKSRLPHHNHEYLMQITRGCFFLIVFM